VKISRQLKGERETEVIVLPGTFEGKAGGSEEVSVRYQRHSKYKMTNGGDLLRRIGSKEEKSHRAKRMASNEQERIWVGLIG
jgi:hypothetical protein